MPFSGTDCGGIPQGTSVVASGKSACVDYLDAYSLKIHENRLNRFCIATYLERFHRTGCSGIPYDTTILHQFHDICYNLKQKNNPGSCKFKCTNVA